MSNNNYSTIENNKMKYYLIFENFIYFIIVYHFLCVHIKFIILYFKEIGIMCIMKIRFFIFYSITMDNMLENFEKMKYLDFSLVFRLFFFSRRF